MKITDYLQSQGIVPSTYSPANPLRVLFDTSSAMVVKPSVLETCAEWHEVAIVPTVTYEFERIMACPVKSRFVTDREELTEAMKKIRKVRRENPNEEELELIRGAANEIYSSVSKRHKKRRNGLRLGYFGHTDTLQIVHALRRARLQKPTLVVTEDKNLKAVLKEASKQRGYCSYIEAKPIR